MEPCGSCAARWLKSLSNPALTGVVLGRIKFTSSAGISLNGQRVCLMLVETFDNVSLQYLFHFFTLSLK